MKPFKDAMDALGLTAPEVAQILERPVQSVYQMRLDPAHTNYRQPPEDWRERLAQVAEARSGEFVGLAKQLRAGEGEG